MEVVRCKTQAGNLEEAEKKTFDLPTVLRQSSFVPEFSLWSNLAACAAQGWAEWAEDSADKSLHLLTFG